MTRTRLLITTLTVLCLLAPQALCTAAAKVSVEARIDSMEILIGQQVGVTVTVTTDKAAKVSFPVYKPLDLVTPGVEVIGMSAPVTRQIERGMAYSCVYTLTSFDENLYYLPPFEVRVDTTAYQTKSLALKVLTVEVDTLNADKFFGPKDVQDNPFQWSEWSLVFWLSVLMLVLMAVTYYLYLCLRDNKPVISSLKIVKQLLPHQKALKSIEQIKAGRMTASENQKEYYTRLTETLRKYIEERYGFYAMEMTSAEIIERLSQVQDKSAIEELRDLFRTADLVKFAKYSALLGENDKNLVSAIEFINSTKIETMPTPPAKPKLTQEETRSMEKRRTLKAAVIALTAVIVLVLIYIVYKTSQL